VAAANRGMRQDDARLRVQQLIRTNVSPHSEVQPRARTPHTDWVVPDNLPHNLFMPEITIDTERHGPYAAVIRNKYRHTAISRTATTVTISNIQFWDALLEWFDLNVDDFNRYLQGHQKHRIRAKLFVIPVDECMVEPARDFVWDLRDYWRDHNAPIRPIRSGDERRTTFKADGIVTLQECTGNVDHDIIDMMQTSIETHAYPEHAIMLCPSSRSFFENAKVAAEKARAEAQEGIIEEFPGPMFLPIRVYQEGYVSQRSGKLRRIGMGNSPSFDGEGFLLDGEDISLNAAIDMHNENNFPEYSMPTVAQHAANAAVIASLHAETHDDRDTPEQLYADWQAYYRGLVPAIAFMWQTCIMIGALFLDKGLYFGSSSAPSIAQRIMSVLVAWWYVLVIISLAPVTSWNVVTSSPYDVGCRTLVSDCGYPSSGERHYDSIRERLWQGQLPACWDEQPPVREWRQRRYDNARAQGIAQAEAVRQTVPLTISGYIDDSQVATIKSIMEHVKVALFLLVAMVNVQVSVDKLQWAVPGKVFHAQAKPDGSMHWAASNVRHAECLGRLLDCEQQLIIDKPERIAELAKMAAQLATKGREHNLVSHNLLRTFLGIAMFVAQIQITARCLLSSLWRALTATTRLTKTRRDRWRQDHLVPWPNEADQDAGSFIALIEQNRGVEFAPATTCPGDTRPFITILNDAAGDANDQGKSFRGGASWVVGAPIARTPWAQYRWRYETECQGKDSTVLELVNGNMTLQAAIQAWPGYDIVEVFDNTAVTKLCISLATKAPQLFTPVKHRGELLAAIRGTANVYTVWSSRDYVQLSDWLSKDEKAKFALGLAERGLPPPTPAPFLRPKPKF
jgi:hypothetical protein